MKKSSLVKVTSNVFGTVLKYNLIATGIIIGGIAVIMGKKGAGRTAQKTGIKLGRFAGKTVRVSGKLAAVIMDAASSEGVRLGRAIGNRVVQSRVRIYGDASEFFDKQKVIEIKDEELTMSNVQ